jgi:hypothetical protein
MLSMPAETPSAASNAAPATRCRDLLPGLRPAAPDRHSTGMPCIVTGTGDRPRRARQTMAVITERRTMPPEFRGRPLSRPDSRGPGHIWQRRENPRSLACPQELLATSVGRGRYGENRHSAL